MQDLLKLKDTQFKTPTCRAFAGNGAIVFAPSIISGKLISSFVIWEYPAETIELKDLDTNQVITVESEMNNEFNGYSTGVILPIINYG